MYNNDTPFALDSTPATQAPTHQPADWTRALPALPAHVTPDLCLEHLAYAAGDPALAAERLGLDSADALLGVMALDETIHARAQAVFRFMQLASLLGALSHVQDEMLSRMEELEARDVAKAYSALVLAAEVFTRAAGSTSGAAQGTTNITFNLLRMLPPDVRNAVKALLPSGPNMQDGGDAGASEADYQQAGV